MAIFSGCYTALVTPMTKLREVDYEGLKSLVEFQVREGINGLLAVGTTGESPTLDWNEHNRVIERVKESASKRCLTIAGTGSNSTQETIEATAHAHHVGVNCVLLVDPYYNGPSSMEIRREYVEPVARQFPEVHAAGFISVVSNVAPRAVAAMAHFILDGKTDEARELAQALQPFFSIVTVKTQEQTSFGPVACKARNPIAYKTLMNILGMPSGPCRQPLGKMTRNGLEVVLASARKGYKH